MAVPLDQIAAPEAAELPPELIALRRALDALTAVDPRELADGAAVVALQRELSRVEAVVCRQAAVFDARKAWQRSGAERAPAWVATHTRVPRRHATRRARLGRALRATGLVERAFLAGTISIDHVDALAAARGRSKVAATAFVRDEAMLVGWAEVHTFADFHHLLEVWAQFADEDAAERRAERQHEQRRFHLSQSLDGQWFGDLELDPVSGEIFADALRTITDELFALDWKLASERLGHPPTGEELAELTRTPTQRRADAAVEMAVRAMTVPADGRAPRPLFTVLVGEEAFARTCELASRTVTTPGSLVRWLDRSVIERIVHDGPDRIIGVSHRRTFEGALRRAVQVRDRRCTDPYCDEPAERCEVDHTHPWALGGATSQANGKLKCDYHNLRRVPPHLRESRRRTRDEGREGREKRDGCDESAE